MNKAERWEFVNAVEQAESHIRGVEYDMLKAERRYQEAVVAAKRAGVRVRLSKSLRYIRDRFGT